MSRNRIGRIGAKLLAGSMASQQLEKRRQSKIAAQVPVIEITHAEFALIHKVGSNEEVAELAKTHERLKMEGDCGNWFICYPKQSKVYLVKFIRERQRTKEKPPGFSDN